MRFCLRTEEAISGVEVAKLIEQEETRVFKTLVCVGASNKNYVFVIPVGKELHLKKAAKVAGEKKMDMLKSKDLLPLTGYVHGGCSPIRILFSVQGKLDIRFKLHWNP